MAEIIDSTKRFLEAVDYLKKKGIVKNNKQLALLLSISPALITEASKGRSNVSIERILKLTEKYSQINRQYIIEGEGPLLKEETELYLTHHDKSDTSGDIVNDQVGYLKNMLEAKEETISSLKTTIDVLKKELKRLEEE